MIETRSHAHTNSTVTEAQTATTVAAVTTSSTVAADDNSPSSTTNTSEATSLPSALPADAVSVEVPILMHRYIDDEPPPAGPYADGLTVRADDFVDEMEYLSQHGYHTVSLRRRLPAMAVEKELPAKPVVLIFDDGGPDN